MLGRSGVGMEFNNASASARRRVKVSAVSDTCGHSASASRNSGSTSSIVLMVGSQVRLEQRKRYGSDRLATSQRGFRISIETAGHSVPRSAGNHPWWTRQAFPCQRPPTTYPSIGAYGGTTGEITCTLLELEPGRPPPPCHQAAVRHAWRPHRLPAPLLRR